LLDPNLSPVNPPNSKKNAAQVCHVYGIVNTGNNVFKDQIPSNGPNTITAINNVMPTISLITDVIIAKIPPKDKQANNLLQLC
jgi:hypothetical protein